jgi:hypothetical protein
MRCLRNEAATGERDVAWSLMRVRKGKFPGRMPQAGWGIMDPPLHIFFFFFLSFPRLDSFVR